MYFRVSFMLFGTLGFVFIPVHTTYTSLNCAQMDVCDYAYKYNYLATCDGPKEAPESATERTPLLNISTAHMKQRMPEMSKFQL